MESVDFTCATESSLETKLRVYKNGMEVNPLELGDITYRSSNIVNEQGGMVVVYIVSLVVKAAYNESVAHCVARRNEGMIETADGLFLIQGVIPNHV